jgi:hypothetical protein
MEKPSIEVMEKQGKLRAAQINRALGLFILFFGIVVISALFFTDTFIGQMTNLVAGLLLSSIGLGMVLVAQYTIKKLS